MKPFGLDALRNGSPEDYTDAYYNKLDEVTAAIRSEQGVKTHIGTTKIEEAEDLVRASLVLSDLTTLTLGSSKKMHVTLFLPKDDSHRLLIPVELLRQQGIDPTSVKPHIGFFTPNEPEHVEFLKSCVPLIETEKLILRPIRISMVKKSDQNWQAFPVNPDSDGKKWIVDPETVALGQLPLRLDSSPEIPLDLAIPYLRGIPFSEFIKILNDAQDTLKNLRQGIKKAIGQAASTTPEQMREFRMDVIDPQIESLQRTFKKIKAVHNYTMGGAILGLISLSLSALGGGGGALSQISGLLGAGPVGLAGKAALDYRTKLEELKDNPFYLFWRARYRNNH